MLRKRGEFIGKKVIKCEYEEQRCAFLHEMWLQEIYIYIFNYKTCMVQMNRENGD